MKIQVEITGNTFKNARNKVKSSFRDIVDTVKTKKIGLVDRSSKIVKK